MLGRIRHTLNWFEPARGKIVAALRHRLSPWGRARHVQISRRDWRPMSYAEIQQVFNRAYPRRWAVMVFPPKEALVDRRNGYHLFVLPAGRAPECFRLDVPR